MKAYEGMSGQVPTGDKGLAGGLGRGLPKELRKFLRECEKQGCVVELGRNNHVKVRLPNGASVPCPLTPKNAGNAVKNLRNNMRRKGWEMEEGR